MLPTTPTLLLHAADVAARVANRDYAAAQMASQAAALAADEAYARTTQGIEDAVAMAADRAN